MGLRPDFLRSPYAILDPAVRWVPAPQDQRTTAYEKLLPPLVAQVREGVRAWRDLGYAGASATSRALLTWWFETPHMLEQADGTQAPFRYYFAQREAVESVIWLYDVRGARDKFDLLRFDASGAVSSNMFDEDWPRFVIKMATGVGKTKVLSLLIAWTYFHKLYEPDSALARNFLLIAPNIIVLDRLRADFDGLRIFFNDPVLPDNGHGGRNWRDDFQIALPIFRTTCASCGPPATSFSPTFIGSILVTHTNPRWTTTICATISWRRSTRSRSERPPTATSTWARSCATSTNLADFSAYYTQGAAEAAIAAMKEGKSEVICEQGQLYKVSKGKDGVVRKDRLTKVWTDWVDYWAVDFDYFQRKEIIKVPVGSGFGGIASLPGFEPPQGELAVPAFEEVWTGGYIFENEWQSFRTRQNRALELMTAWHTYQKPGRYTVAVKVIDIFGNDTMTLVPAHVV